MEKFDEHLEEKYKFIINTDENFGGTYGDVYFGSMYKENDSENKIPVVLKSVKSKNSCQLRDDTIVNNEFNNEKQIAETVSQDKRDGIVKYYGLAHIDRFEYVVMEDLKAQSFKTIEDVCNEFIQLESEYYKTSNIKNIRWYDINNMYSMDKDDFIKQTKQYKDVYNIKMDKNIQETKPKINTINKYVQYKQKIETFFKNTNHLKNLKQILKNIQIHHNDTHEGNVMIDLEKDIIKLIDLGHSKLKNVELLNQLTQVDYFNYKYLQGIFYYLLGTDIDKDKQLSL